MSSVAPCPGAESRAGRLSPKLGRDKGEFW